MKLRSILAGDRLSFSLLWACSTQFPSFPIDSFASADRYLREQLLPEFKLIRSLCQM